MTERMENALNHIKTSVDVDPWAMEEVERVFKGIEDAIVEIQELDKSIPYLGCFKEGWHNSGQKTGLEQALDIIHKHTGVGDDRWG